MRQDIKFCHIRNYADDGVLSPFGGFTIAFIRINPEELRIGLSQCSDQENFSKQIGRAIAAGRLLCNKPKRTFVVKSKTTKIHDLTNELTNWALKVVYGSY
jgi:hypothetical protein